MPWIRQVPVDESTGLLGRLFDAARKRAGRVWHIVQIMSLNPEVLRASLGLYRSVMKGPSPLSRWRREMLATVVATEVGCHY